MSSQARDHHWQTVFYATPFRFDEQGSEQVLKLFKETLNTTLHDSSYDKDEHVFRTTCLRPDSDHVTSTLTKITPEYIGKQEEAAGEAGEFEAHAAKVVAGLIDRRFYDRQRASEDTSQNDDDSDHDHSKKEAVNASSSAETVETSNWWPTRCSGALSSVFPPQLLETLSHALRCDVSLDVHSDCIRIKSGRQHEIGDIMGKLGNIEELQATNPPVSHVVEVQKPERTFALTFVPLVNAEKGSLTRILLHPDSTLAQNRGRNVSNMFECRYCRYDPNLQDSVRSVRQLKPFDKRSTSDIWTAFNFIPFGTCVYDEIPPTAAASQEGDTDGKVEAWVAKVQDAEPFDPTPMDPLHSPVLIEQDGSVDDEELTEPAKTLDQPGKSSRAWAGNAIKLGEAHTGWPSSECRDPRHGHPKAKTRSLQSANINLIDYQDSDGQETGIDETSLPLRANEGPPKASTALGVNDFSSDSFAELASLHDHRVDHGQTSLDPETRDPVQMISEHEDCRTFKKTMRQRAPAPRSNKKKGTHKVPPTKAQLEVPDPAPTAKSTKGIHKTGRPGLVASGMTGSSAATVQDSHLVKGLTKALERARLYAGDVDLELQCGKIMYDQAPKHLKPVFAADILGPALNSSHAFKTLDGAFTSVLSSEGSDFEALFTTVGIDMASPCRRNAYYELLCQDSNRKMIRVKVNALQVEKEPCVVSEEAMLGAVYMHFPQRVWDARLLVMGSRSKGANEAACNGVEELVESLVVQKTDKGCLPLIQGRDGHGLEVKAVRLHALVQYDALQTGDVLLEVKRVYDMGVKRKFSKRIGDQGYFQAACSGDSRMRREQRLWYEVSLGCTQRPHQLNENKAMQLGSKAHWKAEDVLKSINLKGVESLGCRLVEKMDSVGYHNKGPLANVEGLKLRSGESPGVSSTSVADF
ncbi:MAG: hypothetical protein M1828_006281 [Chrysothrix sp. TS-e1954]|nr:MAG: hypothetical protein M1828_006281 [Chrysothrix sp. TS-e1954]